MVALQITSAADRVVIDKPLGRGLPAGYSGQAANRISMMDTRDSHVGWDAGQLEELARKFWHPVILRADIELDAFYHLG
jgi:hypothetical protein